MGDAELDFLRQISERQARTSGAPGRRSRGKRGRRRKRKRKSRLVAPLMAVAFLLVVVGGAGYVGISALRGYLIPPNYSGDGSGEVTVQIQSGDSITEIAYRLLNAGVIKGTKAFVQVADQDAVKSQGIQPGFYQMHRQMSATSAYALLFNPSSRANTTIIIPEGYRMSETFAALSKKTGIPLKNFEAVAAHPTGVDLPSYAHGHLEGYLYPTRYNLNPNGTAVQIIKMMVDQFNQENQGLAQQASAQHLTPGQIIVMASLLQAEGGRTSDYPKIARVLYNRLDDPLPYMRYLQLDTTVLYAQNRRTLYVSDADTRYPSPYNTYLHAGLPPGAIDSPGQAAVQAVLSPSAGNWLYFVTVNPSTGLTKFTNQYKQFQQYQAQLDTYLRQHGDT